MRTSLENLIARIRIPEKRIPPWEWSFSLILIGMYLLTQFLTLLMLLTLADEEVEQVTASTSAYASLIGGLLMALLFFQYTNREIGRARQQQRVAGELSLRQWLHLDPPQSPLWVILFMSLAVAIAVDTLGFILGVSDISLPAPMRGLRLEDGLPFVAGVLMVVAVRPLVEELIFRGVLYPTLLKYTSPLNAIGITALAFSGVHYLIDPEYLWWGLIHPLVLGITAGVVRGSTKSTQAAIGTHVMFGIFIVLRALLIN